MRQLTHTKIIIIITATVLAFLLGSDRESEEIAEANVAQNLSNHTIVREANGKYSMIGKASWYSRRSPGIKKRTANNEIFKDTGMTCAIWGAAFNSKVRVTNLKNGRSIVLRVNDRGPHGRYFRQGRIIDLTRSAFKRIASTKNGLIDVKVEFL